MAGSDWEKRNEHARRLGFRNYYDYRAHDYGKREKLSGDALRSARGHAGPADLERVLRSGRVAVLTQEPYDRGPDGRWREVRVSVQLVDGSQQRFQLRDEQLTDAALAPIRDAIADSGTDIYSSPSLDVLLLTDGESDLEVFEDVDIELWEDS